jgi:hypothetical protein
MTTFTRRPTDPDMIVEILDEEGAILIASRPDYVMLPPELGGQRANVLAVHKLPWEGSDILYTHYELDHMIDGKRLWVAKVSKDNQYYWYSR